mgnify:CR=1 FL=1
MSDESKINELFNMNKSDYVTKQQLTDYSKYLVNELSSTKKEVKGAVKGAIKGAVKGAVKGAIKGAVKASKMKK